jgi:hypothetical protein
MYVFERRNFYIWQHSITRLEFLAYTYSMWLNHHLATISLGSNMKNLLAHINFLFKGSKHFAKYISLLSPICKSNSKLRQLKRQIKKYFRTCQKIYILGRLPKLAINFII